MPFFRVMSRKKSTKRPGLPRKNLLEVAAVQEKGEVAVVEPCFRDSGRVAPMASTRGGSLIDRENTIKNQIDT
jgi:hypothetical protein